MRGGVCRSLGSDPGRSGVGPGSDPRVQLSLTPGCVRGTCDASDSDRLRRSPGSGQRFSTCGASHALKILLRARAVGFADQSRKRRVELVGACDLEVVPVAARAERLDFDEPRVWRQSPLQDEPDAQVRFPDGRARKTHAHHEHHPRFLRDHRRSPTGPDDRPELPKQLEDVRLALREQRTERESATRVRHVRRDELRPAFRTRPERRQPCAHHHPSCRTTSSSAAPVSISAAMTSRPAAKLCVASLTAPSRYGPTNPPVLPTELINAIAAAAPIPRAAPVAIAHNGPKIEARPIIAIDSAVTDAIVPTATVVDARPMALTTAPAATCHRRSPVRSECRPASTIATAPAAYGIAVSRPTMASLLADAVLMICGIQNPTP